MRIAFLFDWQSPEGKVDGTGIGEWSKKVLLDLCSIAGVTPVKFLYALPRWINDTEKKALLKESPTNKAVLFHKDLKDIDVVVTFGPVACWLATGLHLQTYKGTHITSHYLPKTIKWVIPTYAPDIFAYKMWDKRGEVAVTLEKAKRPPTSFHKVIHIPESVSDIENYLKNCTTKIVAFDVETLYNQINEFSISPSENECLYVPIFDATSHRWNEEDEYRIWLSLHKFAMDSTRTWIFHNCVYDLTYLDLHGIHPMGVVDDTMLMHHAMNPEWRKSLGYLCSLYLDVPAWKHLRVKSKKSVNKRGEVD